MKRINFFQRFAAQVKAGQMTQHICRMRVLPGEPLELWAGVRLLGRARVTMRREVTIEYKRYFPVIRVDGVVLYTKSAEAFARASGFPDVDSLIAFFSDFDDLPFQGTVVAWTLEEEAVAA